MTEPALTRRRSVRLEVTNFPKTIAVGQRWAPHEDLYHYILTRSWAGFFLFVVLAFLGTNAIFALLYVASPGSVLHARAGSFEDAFYFSVQTMATIGYGEMSPATRYGHILVTLEAVVGILSVALVTGITFSKFARPTARVLFCERICVAPRNGQPHMMFRMANWRHNQIAEAQLRVGLLVVEKTREGESFRRPIAVKLERDTTALFGLTWTATHLLDETSPFHGEGAIDRLRAQEAVIFVSLTGIDETIGQSVQARHLYQLDDIAWNARFADVLTIRKDGTRVVDYHQIHDVVPLGDQARDVVPLGDQARDVVPPGDQTR